MNQSIFHDQEPDLKWTCLLQPVPGHIVTCEYGTDLNLSVLRGAQRQQSVTEEGLELHGAAGGCDHMDHLHTRCPGPTALHTLLPGITFVAQHVPGEEGEEDTEAGL